MAYRRLRLDKIDDRAGLHAAGNRVAESHDLESGITLFNGRGRSPEAEFVGIFGTVQEHHGAYSHTPAMSEVEVIEAQPTADVRAELSAYGFDEVSVSGRGFIARRDSAT